MIPAYQHLHPYDDEEDMGYVEPVKTKSIVSPTLPLNVKFDITSVMIQLLNLKGVLLGSETDDVNMHIANFIGICILYTILGVDQEAFRLRLFPFSLTGEASVRLGELLRVSITTWHELCK